MLWLQEHSQNNNLINNNDKGTHAFGWWGRKWGRVTPRSTLVFQDFIVSPEFNKLQKKEMLKIYKLYFIVFFFYCKIQIFCHVFLFQPGWLLYFTSASLSSFSCLGEKILPRGQKLGRGVVITKRLRIMEGSRSFIAHTTGVALIPLFVGGDEEMSGWVLPPHPPRLSGSLSHSLDFSLLTVSQFHLPSAAYGAPSPNTPVTTDTKATSQYIFLQLLGDVLKIKAVVKKATGPGSVLALTLPEPNSAVTVSLKKQ